MRTVPPYHGVYELRDRLRNVIYIGHGVLSERLSAYLYSDDPCIRSAYYFRYEKTGSKLGSEQRERALLRVHERKYGELPRCNQRIG